MFCLVYVIMVKFEIFGTSALILFNPFPNDKILGYSKLKEFAGDNFIFDENGRKCSKQVENTVGKGAIACYEQFLLLPKYFQKTFTSDT